jgi:hypothetical protein
MYMDERFTLGVKRVRTDIENVIAIVKQDFRQSTSQVLHKGTKNLVSERKHANASEWDVPWAAGGILLKGELA